MQNSYIPTTQRGGRNQGYPIGAIPTRPTSSLNPSHLRTDALLEPRSASITSIPAFCVQARERAVEARTAITGFADWSQFWLGVDRRMWTTVLRAWRVGLTSAEFTGGRRQNGGAVVDLTGLRSKAHSAPGNCCPPGNCAPVFGPGLFYLSI